MISPAKLLANKREVMALCSELSDAKKHVAYQHEVSWNASTKRQLRRDHQELPGAAGQAPQGVHQSYFRWLVQIGQDSYSKGLRGSGAARVVCGCCGWVPWSAAVLLQAWPDEVAFAYSTAKLDRMRDKFFRLEVMEDILGPDRAYGMTLSFLAVAPGGPFLHVGAFPFPEL